MSYLVRGALGATAVDTAGPVPGRAQSPIYPLQIGAHGAWLEVRSSPADGACGAHGYPCKHPGVDVAGIQGTTVVAPEDGSVMMATDGSSAPFVGYGPWVMVLQGDSGKYHLLGHLDPATAEMAPLGMRVSAGTPIGTTSDANHTHWEVRSKPVPDPGEDNFANNEDPVGWLSRQGLLFPLLLAGGAALLIYMISRRG